MTSNLPVLMFLVPFVAAMMCAAAGPRHRTAAWLAGGALSLTTALAIWTTAIVFTRGTLHTHMGGWVAPLGIEWMVDPLGSVMAVVVAAVALVVLTGVGQSVRHQTPERGSLFYACVLLLISGLMGMTMTADLFNLFVHLEVASLSAYALVAAGQRGAARAAMEYLLIGSIGASLYLLGVGFLYAGTGTLNMADIAHRLAEAPVGLNQAGIVLIIAGLTIKMGLFPLHAWVPGAYTHAPAAASSLMAPLVTKVAAYALVRVLFWVFQPEYLRQQGLVLPLLCWMGAAAMLFGAIKAAMQDDLWRLLAYSSISQMGLIALGVGLANADGLTGALMHIANDALMKGALFLAVATLLIRFDIRRVSQLSMFRSRAPWTTAVILIAGLSLIGVPPLCGFFGKWYVLCGAIETRQTHFAAAIVVGSLATAIYVFRMFEQMLFAKPMPVTPTPGDSRRTPDNSPVMVGMSAVLAVAIILLGLLNQPVVTWLIRPSLPGGL